MFLDFFVLQGSRSLQLIKFAVRIDFAGLAIPVVLSTVTYFVL